MHEFIKDKELEHMLNKIKLFLMKIKFTDFVSEYKHQKKFHNALKKVGIKGEYILGEELKIFKNNVRNFLKIKYLELKLD